ncbi:MAG: hypothetical protein HamCj_06310 [Candidatus Hamiltonella defensa (Ceratovacuna japonica)]
MLTVYVTESAFRCLSDIESFKMESMGIKEATHFTEALLLDAVKYLQEAPERYRFNPVLADFGLRVRERHDQKRGYRILYEIREHSIYILLILHKRQDLLTALYRHQMLK